VGEGHLMTSPDATALIGSLAAVCTTVSFVPQLVKIHRQGGRDLSYGMLLLYLLGLSLWLVYGLRIRAIEVIAANVVGGMLVLAAIVLKRRAEPHDPNGGPSWPRS
jgi:MtN3 and saliva related transmembrane protein